MRLLMVVGLLVFFAVAAIGQYWRARHVEQRGFEVLPVEKEQPKGK